MTITYYVGDSRQVLKTIPDESIDFVATSPPYNIRKDYGIYKDNLSQDEYLSFMKEILKECYRVLKDDGRMAFNFPHVTRIENNDKHFPILDYSKLFIDIGFNVRELLVWYKSKEGNICTNRSTAWGSWLSASNPHMRGNEEYIIIVNKNLWKKESGSKISDITEEEFRIYTKSSWYISEEKNRSHPAPFPIDIPLRLIKLYTFVGDTVLDPFVGSGTTLRACEISGRNGIGIDLNPEYKNCLIDKRFVLSEINKNTYIVKRPKSLFED